MLHTDSIKQQSKGEKMTIAAQADFFALANNTSKRFSIEAFSFTHQYGLNIYFDDLDDLREITKDVEYEFWALHDDTEDAEYQVKTFENLRHIMDYIENGTDPDLIDVYMEIVENGYSTWDEVWRWHENRMFAEDTFDTDYDFGYYLLHEVDCLDVPEHLEHYIDYAAYGRDAMVESYVKIGGYIYHNR